MTDYHTTPKDTIQDQPTYIFAKNPTMPVMPHDFGLAAYGLYNFICNGDRWTRKYLYETLGEPEYEIDQLIDNLKENGFLIEREVRA